MNDLQTRSEASASVAGGGTKVRKKSLFREYAEAIIIAVLLALVIRQFAVQAFTIPSGSMMDTGLRSPEHGDVVVFKYPNDETRDFIKRIVGVGGDTIQVKDNRVWRNGTLIEEPYVKPGSFRSDPSTHCGYLYGCEPLVVPPNSYFVMGDNRDNSQDSRYWGFVKREKIRGKAFVIYWSWNAENHWLRWRRLGMYLP